MPKMKKTIRTKTTLTQPLYNYVTPVNGDWVRQIADKNNMSYSKLVNHLIEFGRKHKFTPDVKVTKRAA